MVLTEHSLASEGRTLVSRVQLVRHLHQPCMWLVKLAFSSLSSGWGPGASWPTQPHLTFADISRPL